MPTPEIFLSYSREDQAVARRFAEAFEREGFSVWWDQQLTAGEAFDEVTEQALKDARAVVVLWSPRSVNSRWVRAEAAQADETGTLVPVLIEPCAVPVKFKLTQTADLCGWSGDPGDARWGALMSGLRRFTGLSGNQPVASPRARERKPSWRVPAIMALLVLVAGAAWYLVAGRETAGGSEADTRVQSPTLAVLPFADLSPAGDQESFADGLTEEILNSLARISGMQVTGRTSSFYFKGRNEPLQSIGQQLGVNYLLEGSVRKEGGALRVTAQLIKAADGFHLWSETYDRTTQDIFAIQEDIARSVANAMQVALGVGEIGRLPGMTRDVQVYQMWLESRSHSMQTMESQQRAIQILESIVQRDPSFELAWLDLYGRFMTVGALYGTDDGAAIAAFDKASQALTEGARRNPDAKLLQAVHRGGRSIDTGYWLEGAAAFDEVESMEIEYARAGVFGNPLGRASWLVSVDKASEAIALLEQARRRDPLDAGVPVYLGEAYANVGRMAEAQAEFARGLALEGSEILTVNALMLAIGSGDSRLIERAWQQIPRQDPAVRRFFELRDDRTQALQELHRLASSTPRILAASRLALWAVAFGDPALAVRVLREDQNRGRRRITALALWRPLMREARQLPEFKELVKEWGFVGYWKQYGWGDHCKPTGVDDFTCQ